MRPTTVRYANSAGVSVIYGVVISVVLAGLFCCERGITSPGDFQLAIGEWAVLASGLALVWSFVALMRRLAESALPDSALPGPSSVATEG